MKRPDYRKVTIESVTKCYGNCDGCTLSDTERRDDAAPQGRALDWATGFARDALSLVQKKDEDGGTFVVFAQGEHLTLARPEEIADMAKAASAYPLTINEFTTALLMPNVEARELLKRVYDRSLQHPVALLPNIVFSPRKVLPTGFRREYLKNIESAIEIFGISDFTVNLGPDVVDIISPKEFNELMILSGIRSMEINLIPVDGSAPLMRSRWRDIIGWMTELMRLWLPDRRKYRLAFPINLAQLLERSYGRGLGESADFFEEQFANELYVDLSGTVHLAGSGGAGVTIPFYGKNGYAAAVGGFPKYGPDVEAQLRSSARRTGLRMGASHLRYEACRSCPYMVTCIASGFTPALTQFQIPPQQAGDRCPLGLIDFMRTAHEALGSSSTYDMDIFHGHVAQKGLKDLIESDILHRPEDFRSASRVDFQEAVAGSVSRVAPGGHVINVVRPQKKPQFVLEVVAECQDLRQLDLQQLGRTIATLQADAKADGVWEGGCDLNIGPADAFRLSGGQWESFIDWASLTLGAQGTVAIGCRTGAPEGEGAAIAAVQKLRGSIEAAMLELWVAPDELPGGAREGEAIALAQRLSKAFDRFYALHVTLDAGVCERMTPEAFHDWVLAAGTDALFPVVRPDASGAARTVYRWLDQFEQVRRAKGSSFGVWLFNALEEAARTLAGIPQERLLERLQARMATSVAVRADGAVHPVLTDMVVDATGQPLAEGEAPARVDAISWLPMRRAIQLKAGRSMPGAPACRSCPVREACAMAGIPRVATAEPGCPSGAQCLLATLSGR